MSYLWQCPSYTPSTDRNAVVAAPLLSLGGRLSISSLVTVVGLFMPRWAEPMTSVEVAQFWGRQAFHHYMPDMGLRTSPRQLSLNHSSLVVDLTAGFLCVRAWPATSKETAGEGQGFKCNVYPSPRLLVLGGGGQSLIR